MYFGRFIVWSYNCGNSFYSSTHYQMWKKLRCHILPQNVTKTSRVNVIHLIVLEQRLHNRVLAVNFSAISFHLFLSLAKMTEIFPCS